MLGIVKIDVSRVSRHRRYSGELNAHVDDAFVSEGIWKRIAVYWGSLFRIRLAESRYLLIDAMRGLCFVFMTINHIPGNVFARFCNAEYGLFGFFTSASGFVFLSGLVTGFRYETYRRTHGFKAVTVRVMRRFIDVYLAQMVLYFTLFGAVWFHVYRSSTWRLDLFSENPLKALVLGVTLLYEPGLLGILPMYCLFLAVTPLMLWQLRSGHVWRVLVASVALWLVSGLVLRLPNNPTGVDFGAFNPLGYQILFVVGLVLGARQVSIDRLGPATKRMIVAGAVILSAFFFSLRIEYALSPATEVLVDQFRVWFSLIHHGPLRLLNFAAFAVTVSWLLGKKDWLHCYNPLFRWLVFLGQHSLPVFVWSILITYFAVSTLRHDASGGLRVLVASLAVISLTLPAFVHAKHRRRRKAVPVPIPNDLACGTYN